jgi:hypothetical protein
MSKYNHTVNRRSYVVITVKKGDLMNKSISIVLLVAAVVLIAFGLNAYHSASSDVSRFFTGAPTDKALWLLIGGLAAGIIGGVSLSQSKAG